MQVNAASEVIHAYLANKRILCLHAQHCGTYVNVYIHYETIKVAALILEDRLQSLQTARARTHVHFCLYPLRIHRSHTSNCLHCMIRLGKQHEDSAAFTEDPRRVTHLALLLMPYIISNEQAIIPSVL